MTRFEALREVVAAQMCGRWQRRAARHIARLSLDRPALSLTNFEYDGASRCPAGFRISGAPIPRRPDRAARRQLRRLVRRGIILRTRSISQSPTNMNAACR